MVPQSPVFKVKRPRGGASGPHEFGLAGKSDRLHRPLGPPFVPEVTDSRPRWTSEANLTLPIRGRSDIPGTEYLAREAPGALQLPRPAPIARKLGNAMDPVSVSPGTNADGIPFGPRLPGDSRKSGNTVDSDSVKPGTNAGGIRSRPWRPRVSRSRGNIVETPVDSGTPFRNPWNGISVRSGTRLP